MNKLYPEVDKITIDEFKTAFKDGSDVIVLAKDDKGEDSKHTLICKIISNKRWDILEVMISANYDCLEELEKEKSNIPYSLPKSLYKFLVDKGIMPVKMAVETIHVSYGMTLNIGNFESFRADAGATIRNVNGIATTEEMYTEGWAIVSSQLREQIAVVRKKTKKSEED